MLIVIIIDASFLDYILNVLKEGAFIFSHSTFHKSKLFFGTYWYRSKINVGERERSHGWLLDAISRPRVSRELLSATAPCSNLVDLLSIPSNNPLTSLHQRLNNRYIVTGCGQFNCCQQNHDYGDGPDTVVCDKVACRSVIANMIDAKVRRLIQCSSCSMFC